MSSFIRHFIFFLLWLSGGSIYAQRELVDSILQNYPSNDIYKKMEQEFDLSVYYKVVDLDSALLHLDQCLELAKLNQADTLYIKSLSNKGIYYGYKNLNDSARYFHERAIQISQLLKNKSTECSSYNNLAILEWENQNLEVTLNCLLNSLKIAVEIGDRRIERISTGNIAVIYHNLGQDRKALQYCYQSLDIAKRYQDESARTETYLNMSLCYDALGLLDSASWAIQMATEENKKEQDRRLTAKILGVKGAIAFSNKQYETSKKLTQQSYDLNVELMDIGQIDNLINLSMAHFALKEYQEGIEAAEGAKAYLDQGFEVNNARDAYIYSAFNKAAIGEYESAIYDYKLFIDYIDTSFSTKMANAVSELEISYQTEKKERLLQAEKLKTVEQKSQLVASDLKISTRNNWLIITIALSILITLLSLYLIQRIKRRNEVEKERLLLAEQLHKTELMIEMQEKERARISKDLHDGIGQQLSGLKLTLHGLMEDFSSLNLETKNKIKFIDQELSRSADEVRAISHIMMPRTLQQLGLVPALQDLLEKTFAFLKIDYTFEEHNAQQRFQDNIEICFYRIAQELINNSIKHADANLINLQLVKSKSYLTLLIEDNGIGLQGTTRTGHGMANIETRITSIGGEVNYTNSPNGGTLATVRVPI